MNNSDVMHPDSKRKPYLMPMIVYETELEIQAGSPLGLPEPLESDLFTQ